MSTQPRQRRRRSTPVPASVRAPALVAGLVFAALLLCGGSARPDVLPLLLLRPALVLGIAALLLLRPAGHAASRQPLVFLAAFAVTVAVQLVPLPPALWSALPGHARFLEAAAAAGVAQPWRPVSITPDLTLNALLGLLPALFGLLCVAALGPEGRRWLLPALVGGVLASEVMGILQVAGRIYGPVYFYKIDYLSNATGLLANRNHQAVWLATLFPVLRAWTMQPAPDRERQRWRAWTALGLALFTVPMILATGSRAGLALGGLGVVCALAVAPVRLGRYGELGGSRPVLLGAGALAVVLVVLAVAAGRATSIDRLTGMAVGEDLRFQFLPVILKATRDFLPFGSGFGSFDAVFRLYEPDWALKPTYFNRAHDDLAELALTGGAAALAVAVAFLVALGRRGWAITAGAQRGDPEAATARAALAVVAILLLASLTDYPLRTPLLGFVFAVAAALVFGQGRTARAGT